MKHQSIAALVAIASVSTSAALAVAADCFINDVAMGSFANPLLCQMPGTTAVTGTAWGSSNVPVTVNLNGGFGTSFATSYGFNAAGTRQNNCRAHDTNTSSGVSNTDSTDCGSAVRQDLTLHL